MISLIKEKNLQDKVIELLDRLKIYYINIYGSGYTAKGAPDIIMCVNGEFVALELKVGNNDLSNAQKIHMTRIVRSQGKHYTPRSIDEVKAIIETLGG